VVPKAETVCRAYDFLTDMGGFAGNSMTNALFTAASVVADQALLSEIAHELTYPCSRSYQPSPPKLIGSSSRETLAWILFICPNNIRTRASRLSLKLKN